MSTLQRALVYAGRGLKVFPLAPHSKIPLISNGHGHLDASDDPEVVTSMFSNTPDANIGISAALSDLVIVDVDVGWRKKTKRLAVGDQTMAALVEKHDWYPDTLTVKTSGGGLHYYFRARPGAEYKAELGEDVQVKFKGYVVAPGSVVDGVEYTIINKGQIEQAPKWMEKEPRKPRRKGNGEGELDLDMVTGALKSIDPDCDRDQWIRVGMSIHAADHGGQKGYELYDLWSSGGLHDKTAEKYDPSDVVKAWDSFDDKGEIKAGTIYYIAQEYGWHAPNKPAMGRSDDRAHESLGELESLSVGRFWASRAPEREYLGCFPAAEVGMIVATGGTGKSMLMIQIALSIATGTPILNQWGIDKPGPVFAMFGEDDEGELHRRFQRAYETMNIEQPPEMYVQSVVGRKNELTDGYTSEIIRLASQVNNLKCIMLEPYSRFRIGEENSADDATKFVVQLERIKEETGAMVLFSHHARKGSSGQEAARGSSALSDACRFQMNMDSMTEEQGQTYGVADPTQYVKFSNPVNNYGPRFEPLWLRRGVTGVMHVTEIVNAKDKSVDDIASELLERMLQGIERGVKFSKHKVEEVGGTIPGATRKMIRDLITDMLADGRLEKHREPGLNFEAIYPARAPRQ